MFAKRESQVLKMLEYFLVPTSEALACFHLCVAVSSAVYQASKEKVLSEWEKTQQYLCRESQKLHKHIQMLCWDSEALQSMKELLNIMEQLAGSALPKNVLGILLMLRLVHFVGSCRTDTFTSMSNGKQNFCTMQTILSCYIIQSRVFTWGYIQAKLHSQKTRLLCLAVLLM